MDGIDMAEDRERFRELANKLSIPAAAERHGDRTRRSALEVASRIGYPVVVRPSYVIAGSAMEIVRSDEELRRYIHEAVDVSHERPVLIDKYIDNAIECEVDAVSDGKRHIHRRADGAHRARRDPFRGREHLAALRSASPKRRRRRSWTTRRGSPAPSAIVGLVNIQFVVKKGTSSTCWRPTRVRAGPSRSSASP